MNHSNNSCKDTYFANLGNQSIISWENISVTFNNSFNFETYMCAYNRYFSNERIFQIITGYTSTCCSFIGFISSILTLITLKSSSNYFKSSSFIYFRLIASFELFDMMVMLSRGLRYIFPVMHSRTYYWYWFTTYIGNLIGNGVSACVDHFTIFLSVERAVASLKPSLFNSIHKESVVWKVTAVTICISVLLYVPQCFALNIVPNQDGTYSRGPSDWGRHTTYVGFSVFVDIYLLFLAGSATFSAVLVVLGMVRFLKLR